MIKISVISGAPEKSLSFSETSVFIGDPSCEKIAVTFPITGRGLKPEHIRIYQENNTLWVQNLANDPFVTLNGQPFYKKQADLHAVLRIKEIDLKLELSTVLTEPQADNKSEQEAPVSPVPTQEIFPRKIVSSPHAVAKSQQAALILAREEIKESPDTHEEEVFHTFPKNKKDAKHRASLKDHDHHFDKDDHKEGSAKENSHWPSHLNVSPFRHVKLLTFFLMVFFLISSVVLVEYYLRAGEQIDQEELNAAESLSDIAMALTYAQFYHIAPKKHNWSDPDFIQNNLLATLPTGSESKAILNAQGEFSGKHYILRVYTSNDLSHFLIVAHPTPTLLQWLIPKSALIVDSNSMELRRIRDLKNLNRLLANLNTLDGANSFQISDLEKKGEIISLAYLAKMAGKPEFQPPQMLGYFRPGAENLIYNSPRYHQFGDALLKKANHFASVHTSSHELAMLQSELDLLKKFPNLVLYTTESLEEAKTAIQALKIIGPHEKYLLASIKYDAQGKFRSTKIVMDVEKRVSPLLNKVKIPTVDKATVFEINPDLFKSEIPIEKFRRKNEEEASIAIEDEIIEPTKTENTLPEKLIFKKIDDIQLRRKEETQKIDNEILAAVNDYFNSDKKKKLLKTLDKIALQKTALNERIKEDLFDLYFDFEDSDPVQMDQKIKEAQLDDLWKDAFDTRTP